jgi:hypothetical protein
LEHDGASVDVFDSPDTCRAALDALTPNADHMLWFEYNFLYVLAAEGKSEKSALGDHKAAGYEQRKRFYSISDEGQLRFAQGIARYICFLADTTGLADKAACDSALSKLNGYSNYAEFLDAIG